MKPIRLLDLGLVPPVRSQTMYHAVAYAMDENSPDTIILIAPDAPCVCVGFHQELEKEVDVEYCREHGLPIFRREVGGGAAYHDRNQVFAQWVFNRGAVPPDLCGRFALYLKPLVETYTALGIPATVRPLNEIRVNGKKIGGTGAAQMGSAEVMIGSLIFDLNVQVMSRVLRVPSEQMRAKNFRSVRDDTTTMTQELDYTPDRNAVCDLYIERCAAAFNRPILPGDPTEQELALAAELDEQFATDEWVDQKGGLRHEAGIAAEERVASSTFRAPGGLVRVTARLHQGRIQDLTLSGDFIMLPKFAPAALELGLRGVALDAHTLNARVGEVYRRMQIQSPGVTPDDVTGAVMQIVHVG